MAVVKGRHAFINGEKKGEKSHYPFFLTLFTPLVCGKGIENKKYKRNQSRGKMEDVRGETKKLKYKKILIKRSQIYTFEQEPMK